MYYHLIVYKMLTLFNKPRENGYKRIKAFDLFWQFKKKKLILILIESIVHNFEATH